MKKSKKIRKELHKLNLLLKEYNLEGIKFPSKKKCFETNWERNVTIGLNVLYAKNGKTYPAYVSKHNSNHEKQAIWLRIQNRERWHYFAVKKLSTLLRGIKYKHHGHLYCLKCFYLFTT